MTCSRRLNRVLIVGVIAAATAAGPLAHDAAAATEGPDVPETIEVDPGHKVFLVGHAVGVQIYSCNPVPGGFQWGLVAPRAELYDDDGTLVATHFGGPTWQARDGSTVVARRVDGVTVEPTAIPWLLLERVRSEAGSDGDQLTNTTFIQRTATTGGIQPPAKECNKHQAGTTREVPYTADYHFWKAAGG